MSSDVMPGPEGKVPRFYEVDRGTKTESYITAVSGNPLSPSAIEPASQHPTYSKNDDVVALNPTAPAEAADQAARRERRALTEDELTHYRDHRGWKTLRLLLFVLFWLIWLLLFVLAILLVFFSPGCVVKIAPSWWNNAVNYNVWVPSFQDSDGDGLGDFEGLIQRLDNLRKTGVKAVWPSPFLLSDDFSNAIRSFRQIDSKLGVNQVAEKLIQAVHDNNMQIIISLPIATTSTEHEWFLASASASLPQNANYSQFYHWSSTNSTSGLQTAYKSLFYLHEKGNPKAAVLNWKSDHVRKHMMDVLTWWIEQGVDGFHLTGIEYLSRTKNATQTDWEAVSDILGDIRHAVDDAVAESAKHSEKKIALFASREEAKEADKRLLTSKGLDSVINYEFARVKKNSDICPRSEGTVASCVHEIISDVLLFHTNYPKVWPQWEFGNAFVSRAASRVGSRAHAELLTMLELLLPGTANVYYGEEIAMRDLHNDTIVPVQRGAMQWDDSPHSGFSSGESIAVPSQSDYANINWKRQYSEEKSALKTFKRLAQLRNRDEVLMGGKALVGRLVDLNAFTITRFIKEFDEPITTPIYFAALNFADESVTIPLVDMPNFAQLHETTVVALSSNVEEYYARQKVDLSAKSVKLGPDQGIVFKYNH